MTCLNDLLEIIMLEQRLTEMKEAETLPQLEELYFGICYDIGFLNNNLKDHLQVVRSTKKKIEANSIAAFKRAFEETETYIILKAHEYEISGLDSMRAGVRVKIESLKAESKGSY